MQHQRVVNMIRQPHEIGRKIPEIVLRKGLSEDVTKRFAAGRFRTPEQV